MSSFRCVSEEFWNMERCVRCEEIYVIEKGYEFNPHCGRSDNGGATMTVYTPCLEKTFNSGSFVKCQPCSTCPKRKILAPCTSTSDTLCCEDGQGECRGTTERSASGRSETSILTSRPTLSLHTVDHTTEYKRIDGSIDSPALDPNLGIGIGIGALFITILICLCLIHLLQSILKRKRGSSRRRSLKNNATLVDGKACVTQEPTQVNVEEFLDIKAILPPDIQAAPLQTVLNNMDVVEELVFLLDPDTSGVKCTRHLAASCSIPFTWINYAYSIKGSKSPLIAMLERVIASHPHWNVGHFAGLLNNIGRNDAVVVLRKLAFTGVDV